MAAEKRVHFVIMPMAEPGHIIPMVNFGLLLASRGMRVSVVTTPVNAARIQSAIDRAKQLDLPIDFVKLRFPYAEVGLPQGLESMDMVTTFDQALKVMGAITMLEEQLIGFLRTRPILPTCLIADFFLPWTQNVAQVANIPRYVFYSACCFTLYCHATLPGYYEKEGIPSGSTQQFEVPGLQHHVMISRAQAPGFVEGPAAEAISTADRTADGIVINTFQGLEPEYVESYSKAVGNTVWTVGPVSLFDKESTRKSERGGVSAISEREVVEWLDVFEPKSVIYVCQLGSFVLGDPRQVEEIALGLEGSGHPFILVVGTDVLERGAEEFMGVGFEERVRGKGLVIRGWAPHMAILSHPSIGGFLTHSKWNSTLEAIAGGIPMATWPCLFDHFLNERLAVDVIGTGVAVGIERPSLWSGEATELVGREKVRVAVEKLMGEGEEREGMRRRAMELREKARRAMEEGGSSHVNITGFIQDALRRAIEMSEKGKC